MAINASHFTPYIVIENTNEQGELKAKDYPLMIFKFAYNSITGLSTMALNVPDADGKKSWKIISNPDQYYTKEQIDDMMSQTISKVYRFKGNSKFEDLPTSGNITGDSYNITNAFVLDGISYQPGTNVAWTGSKWDALEGDSSNKEDKVNKVTSISSDSTDDQYASAKCLYTNIEEVLAAINAETSDRTSADEALQNNIDSEASTRESADEALQNNIDSEASTRESADETLQNNIDAESANRESADETLQNNIDAESTNRESADKDLSDKIKAEETARTNADETLQTNIDNEISNRSSEDAKLQSNIDTETANRISADETLQDNIDSEAATRESADATLQSNIDAEKTARESAITSLGTALGNESKSRADMDATLKQSIDGEIVTRKTADDTLTTNLATEVTNRTAADSALDEKITAEVIARENADNTLDGKITDEATARTNADNTLDSKITTETTNRTSADSALDGKITAETTNRTSADSALDGKITAEATARESADNALDEKITAEATARESADNALDEKIADETTNRTSADSALDEKITAEATARGNADSTLEREITAETNNRTASDRALGEKIEDEATDRASADSALDEKISAEANTRANADTTLEGKITTEATDRANADTALQNNIDAKADDTAVVHLTGDETISGVKKFTGSIQFNNDGTLSADGATGSGIVSKDYVKLGASGTIASDDKKAVDGDTVFKYAEDKSNKVTSLSSESTDNQYPSAKLVYDQLSAKAADSDVVHKTGNETIDGIKTFNNRIDLGSSKSYVKGYSDGAYIDFYCTDVVRFFVGGSGVGYIAKSGVSGIWEGSNYIVNGATIYNFSEAKANKVTSLSSDSTDTQYASAKCIYDALGGKANSSHTHAISDVTDLQSSLDAKEITSNKTTSITSTSTDTQYPTALAVYNLCKEISDKFGSIWRIKGTCKYSELPTEGMEINDVWILSEAGGDFHVGDEVYWNGTVWTAVGVQVDFALFEKVANKVTSLSSDSTDTQYPSAKSVYDQLLLKANDSNVVHIDGNETITGTKTIKNFIHIGTSDQSYCETGIIFDYLYRDNVYKASISASYYFGNGFQFNVDGTNSFFVSTDSSSSSLIMANSTILMSGGAIYDYAEKKSNKVKALSSTSTDDQYASAKCVYNALEGKAAVSHTHAISDVTDLQSTLDGKAAKSHTHTIADVANLQDSLDAKELLSNKVTSLSSTSTDTQYPSALATYNAINAVETDLSTTKGKLDTESSTRSSADTQLSDEISAEATARENADTTLQTNIDGKADTVHTHAISDVTGLQTAIDAKANNNTVVHTTEDETVAGKKTFSSQIQSTGGINISGTSTTSQVIESTVSTGDITSTNNNLARSSDVYSFVNDNYEKLDNKVTKVSSDSTDDQYPTAKAVYDQCVAPLNDKVDKTVHTFKETTDYYDTVKNLDNFSSYRIHSNVYRLHDLFEKSNAYAQYKALGNDGGGEFFIPVKIHFNLSEKQLENIFIGNITQPFGLHLAYISGDDNNTWTDFGNNYDVPYGRGQGLWQTLKLFSNDYPSGYSIRLKELQDTVMWVKISGYMYNNWHSDSGCLYLWSMIYVKQALSSSDPEYLDSYYVNAQLSVGTDYDTLTDTEILERDLQTSYRNSSRYVVGFKADGLTNYTTTQSYDNASYGAIMDLSVPFNKRELLSNKVTSISSESTDGQYPSALACYTALSGIVKKVEGSSFEYTIGTEKVLNIICTGGTSVVNVPSIAYAETCDILINVEFAIADTEFSIKDSAGSVWTYSSGSGYVSYNLHKNADTSIWSGTILFDSYDVAAKTHTHAISDVTGLEKTLNGKQDVSFKENELTNSQSKYPSSYAVKTYVDALRTLRVNMAESTANIDPNKFYVWGEVTELNITLNDPTDTTIYNEYMIQFTSGDTATELSLPEDITWYLDDITILANHTYQISIVNNMAILSEF